MRVPIGVFLLFFISAIWIAGFPLILFYVVHDFGRNKKE